MKNELTRREVLKKFGLAGSSIALLSACGRDSTPPLRPDARLPNDAAPASQCDLTDGDIEGPFHQDNSPSKNDFFTDAVGGVELLLVGTVKNSNCIPLSGILIDIWQADSQGQYPDNLFRGRQLTNDSGEYSLRSIVPGRYLNGNTFRPAHLHIKVGSGSSELTTQLYFPDDPFNAEDPWFDEARMVTVTSETAIRIEASYDFVYDN